MTRSHVFPYPSSPLGTPRDRANAFVEMVSGLDLDLAVTNNFNCEISERAATDRMGEWFGRIDRAILKYGWSKAGDRRTFAVTVIEHPFSNLHAHSAMRLPERARHDELGHIRQLLADLWEPLVPRGSCCVKPIRDQAGGLRGWAKYMTKDLHRSGPRREDKYFLSTQFHNRTGCEPLSVTAAVISDRNRDPVKC